MEEADPGSLKQAAHVADLKRRVILEPTSATGPEWAAPSGAPDDAALAHTLKRRHRV